ncbi:LacI family DNA-binding transcriptional regulator [Anaerocolumna sp. MB42-C2]|uniref:LacI family DNA-binding transcriptional regulator n=1 Tax=Anaerocolumna sp. MB42-C2 TaxID=3070997 RepID=UPI0027E1C519|nr:LacI family DNA-binding transcriptional regulator [Anaerocolumna sp. MB42-C2]WMJ85703.1 LacI family DNA-binding transcriptional regulator [Anaerocolumna sp. MB42-C2]
MGSTIKDIAKDTNLSLATISKYLNGKNILPENKKLIEESIKKLGYKPNKTAQNLRSKKTNTICILLPFIGDYFWGFLCSIMEEYLRKYNYSTIISSYDAFSDDNTSELQFLLSKQVDGVILVPEYSGSITLPSLLLEAHIPFVCLDQELNGLSSDFVTSNNRTSAYQATKYFLENGHKIFGAIGGDLTSYTMKERISGMRDACREYNIPEDNLYIYGGDIASSADFFRNIMSMPNHPTAMLMLSYNYTLGTILTLSELGLQIPKDFSLISFDDDEIFSAFNPPITTVVQNLNEIGRQATGLLIKRINGDYELYPETKMIETKLIVRKSVANISTM